MLAKICGITNLQDAQHAINSGVWALGFNFYEKSPRSINLDQGKNIIDQLPEHILKVGIFIEQTAAELELIMKQSHLDLAQVYHHDYSEALKKKMIFCVQTDNPSYEQLKNYAYILIDAPRGNGGAFGGTGQCANWEIAHKLSNDFNLILAGGLNPKNISEAIQQVQPFAVDVASGLEISPGIKDHHLITQFMREVKHAN